MMVMPVWVSRLPVGSSARIQVWVHRQRSGDGYPLLLPTGELVGQVILSIRQTDELQSFVCALSLLFSVERRLRIKHGQIDVVSNGSARQQVESLKDKPNFLVPNFRSFFRRQAQYIHVVQLVIFIRVDFPEPLASIIAANSPG